MLRLLLLIVALSVAGCKGTPTEPSGNGGGGAGGGGGDAATSSDLQFCADETNRYRAIAGAAAVTRSPAIEAYAATAAQSDATTGTPHGYSNANATGTWGENEMLRQSLSLLGGSVRTAIQQGLAFFWSEGPSGPHYQIFAGNYTQVGCGVFVSGNQFTFIQHFRR